MKTRICSLPLVILVALFWGNAVFAQNAEHSPLFAYLDKLPEAPSFPDDPTLISTPPVHFEDLSDLNALEKNLQLIVNGSQKSAPQTISEKGFATKLSPPGAGDIHSIEDPNIRRIRDTMLLTLKNMQSVKTQFEENFQRLENVYGKKIGKIYDASHQAEKDNPCGNKSDCLAERAHKLNKEVISATREKVTSEAYLLSVYLTRIKPSFKLLDDYLQANASENQANKEIKNVFRGAQQDELLLLTGIIERLKLERIAISNCARLAQQGL